MFSDKIEGIEKLKAVIPEDMQHWYLFGRHLSELHFRSDYDKYGDEIRCIDMLFTDSEERYRIKLCLYNVVGQIGFDVVNGFFSGLEIEYVWDWGYEKGRNFHIYSAEQDIEIGMYCERITAEIL